MKFSEITTQYSELITQTYRYFVGSGRLNDSGKEEAVVDVSSAEKLENRRRGGHNRK